MKVQNDLHRKPLRLLGGKAQSFGIILPGKALIPGLGQIPPPGKSQVAGKEKDLLLPSVLAWHPDPNPSFEAQLVIVLVQGPDEAPGAAGIGADLKDSLEGRGIQAPSGGRSWPKRTIEKILTNEKYSGSVILYKTYSAEYPAIGQIENHGQHEKLRVDDHHPAIISPEMFTEVQSMIEARKRKNSVVI